jgi:hypothetical protein
VEYDNKKYKGNAEEEWKEVMPDGEGNDGETRRVSLYSTLAA